MRIGLLTLLGDLGHLQLDGLGLVIMSLRVLCGQSLTVAGPCGQGMATCRLQEPLSFSFPFLLAFSISLPLLSLVYTPSFPKPRGGTLSSAKLSVFERPPFYLISQPPPNSHLSPSFT